MQRIIQDFLNESFKEKFLEAFVQGSLEKILKLEKIQIDLTTTKNLNNQNLKTSVKTIDNNNVVIINNY